jgi:hypothetical protein
MPRIPFELFLVHFSSLKKRQKYLIGFVIFTAVTMSNAVFRDVARRVGLL